MTTIDHVIVNNAKARPGYFVHCHQCQKEFSASAASWCKCDRKFRTLVCTHCSTCFCAAPIAYKRRFWENAPADLRENVSRFRVSEEPALLAAVVAPAVTARQRSVLVVDDEEDIRSLVVCYLEQMGYDVTSVSSPADALTMVENMSFEVVVTDALMPKMDGRELCRRLKATFGHKMKVVLMTSLYTARRFQSEAQARFGVDEYLTKPLQFATLQSAMDRVAPIVRLRAAP